MQPSELPEELDITIKSVDKKELKFKFPKTTTIKDIKIKLAQDFSLEQKDIRLIYRAKKLEDETKLMDFCQEQSTTIYIVARLGDQPQQSGTQQAPTGQTPRPNPSNNQARTGEGIPPPPPNPLQGLFGNMQNGQGGLGGLVNQVFGSLQNMQSNPNAQPGQLPPELAQTINNFSSMFANPQANSRNPNQAQTPFSMFFGNLNTNRQQPANPAQAPAHTPNLAPAPQTTEGNAPTQPTPPPRETETTRSAPPPPPRAPQNPNPRVRFVNSSRRINHVESIDTTGINLLISSGTTWNNENGERVHMPTQTLRDVTHFSETNNSITDNYFRSNRNACTLASSYLRSVNQGIHDLGRELEWAAVALENEARESDAGYRNMQSQRMRNIGQMLGKMEKTFNDLKWMNDFELGDAPGKFYLKRLRESAETPNPVEQVPVNENEGNGSEEFVTQEEDNEVVREVPPPPQEQEPVDAGIEIEKMTVNKYKELLERGIPIDKPMAEIEKEIRKEIKEDPNSANIDESILKKLDEEEDPDLMSLLMSEMNHTHIFSILEGNLSSFDSSWPSIKKKYQDLVLKHSNDEDVLCEKLLSGGNSALVDMLIEEKVFEESFDPHGLYLEIDREFFPRFNQLLLGEYRLKNESNPANAVQNMMSNLLGRGVNLPPQLQNFMGNATGQTSNEATYTNPHLPLFSELLDDLLVEYWGRLVYEYSKNINGGYEFLKEYLNKKFENYVEEFLARHGFNQAIPINLRNLFQKVIGDRIEKGYKMELEQQEKDVELMKIMEAIENAEVKTTSEALQAEFSSDYKKGDLMKS